METNVDYFQGVVTEYLRADRSVFVNTECRMELDDDNSRTKGRHWYCDVVACNFREKTVFLCEITYSKTMQALVKRLRAWESHWPQLRNAIVRDCSVPADWRIQPWVFVPKEHHEELKRRVPATMISGGGTESMPAPRVTYLESVCPWNYDSADRKADDLATDE